MAQGAKATSRAQRRPRAKAQREEQYASLLDSVEFVSEVVEKLADGAFNVPGLKSAAGLVTQIVQMAKAVKLNRKECDDLVEKVCDIFNTIAQELQGQVVIDPRLHLRLQAFQRELLRVKHLVEMLSSRRYIIRFLFHMTDRRAIDDCKARISDAFQRLELGHMIRCEEGLTHISGGVNAIFSDVRTMALLQERQNRRWQLELAHLDHGRRIDKLDIIFRLNDLAMRISNTIGFKADQYIRLMSPAKILWHQWAINDAQELNRTMPCYKNDAQTWVEAKMVKRLLTEWPTASRAIVSGWYDFASHDEHMHEHSTKFYIHIEYTDKRYIKRYVLIVLHATGLEGKEGQTMSLDENAELVQEEMDEVTGIGAPYDILDYDDPDPLSISPPDTWDAQCRCVPPWMF